MLRNACNSISLLVVITIFVLSSCSAPRSYSSVFKKKDRAERYESRSKTRTSRSTSKNTSRTSRRTYTSASTKRNKIVKTAKKYMGKPYVYGGKKPSSGFDCSGFTAHVYNENGVPVSGPSYQQAKQGKKKAMRELKEGDLVFFGSGRKVTHVAIVANADRNKLEVIHSTSSRGVVIDDISNSDYWQKRYLFGRDVIN